MSDKATNLKEGFDDLVLGAKLRELVRQQESEGRCDKCGALSYDERIEASFQRGAEAARIVLESEGVVVEIEKSSFVWANEPHEAIKMYPMPDWVRALKVGERLAVRVTRIEAETAMARVTEPVDGGNDG